MAGVLPVGDAFQIVLGLGSFVTGVLQVLERYSADSDTLVVTAGLAASVVVIFNYGTGDDGSQSGGGPNGCPGCGGGR